MLSNKRPTIGVLAGWQFYEGTMPTSFLEPLYRGIMAAAKERDCHVLMACGMYHDPTSHHPAWPVAGPDQDFVPVGPWNTDGLLVIPALLSEERSRYIQGLIQAGHPVVFIGNGEPGPTIVADNASGIYQALTHLTVHGHKRIAFLGGKEEDSGESQRRLDAYRAFVRDQALEADERLVVFGHFDRFGGVNAMRRLLAARVPFTAVLAFNDEVAKGAIQALQEVGRHIPEDVAVIGFDDQLDARSQTPLLTTVHQPIFELGFQGFHWLVDKITNKPSTPHSLVLPTRLVVRRSCGCLPETALGQADPSLLSTPTLDALQSQLAANVKETVLAEIGQLGEDEVARLSRQLVTDLCLSITQNDILPFRTHFMKKLGQIKTTGDDIYVWLSALAIFEKALPTLLALLDQTKNSRQAESLLNQARALVSEQMRWQYTNQQVHQTNLLNQLGQMMARSLATLDENHILHILAESLPAIGVQHAQVFFYEPNPKDPTAWSKLPPGDTLALTTPLFQTRQFPPPGLYPSDQAQHLALLPLIIQDLPSGYVVFDANNLEPCAAIVRQLASALRSARLYQESAQGRELAEEASRMKSRFLSTVSHELHNPLNLIIGLSEILQDQWRAQPNLPTSYGQDLENLHASAQHLSLIIRDLLDLASSDAGRLRLEVEPLNLPEVLEIALATGQDLARRKGLTWEAHIPTDLPILWGDRTRLRQIALNLVSNAAKFTHQGKISLVVEQDASQVTVAVSDTGLGIPPAEQRLIFNEFRQSERTAARGYGGLGLGLAICKRLVELHGGRIEVRSPGNHGVGSTFLFTLPILENVNPFPGPISHQGQNAVLLLTEQAEHTAGLREHLSSQGFEAQILSIHTEASVWLQTLWDAPPSAILLDFPLASQRGWEIVKLLKANPVTSNIPVLFYSLLQEKNSGSVLELNYMAKPLSPVDVKQALEQKGLFDTPQEEKTILIVDDEPAILEMNARMIQAQAPNYHILKAQNGRDGLKIIREKLPDLVLLDLTMPEMDGFSVIEAMQQESSTRSIPVVVLTAQVLTEEDMLRLNRGVAMVLSKGVFSTKETLAHVEEVLTRNRKLGNEIRQIVRKVMAYLHTNYAEPITPEMLANHVGISEGYLFRSFKQEMGLTPMNYLNRYRVNQAKELLSLGTASITQLALQVGFSNNSHFTRLFEKEVGLSPSAYRKGARKNKD